MAFTLDSSAKRGLAPAHFDGHTRDCLYALNAFRQGHLYRGLRQMGIHDITIIPFRDITPYDADRDAFRADMGNLANDLEAIGL